MIDEVLRQIRQCKVCEASLPLGANPVIRAHQDARIMVIGQAPGMRVHQTSIPWNDPSGDRLRHWMGLTREQFYNERDIAIMPMGLCYPGKGRSGDLPPRKECAPLWHERVMALLPNIQMTLLVGQYAQNYYLRDKPKTLTETVKRWQQWAPQWLPLPHPSPRNTFWLKNNPWFETDVVTYLKQEVNRLL